MAVTNDRPAPEVINLLIQSLGTEQMWRQAENHLFN